LQEHAQPGQILIDEEVVSRLGGTLQAHALGELKLKGRQKHARQPSPRANHPSVLKTLVRPQRPSTRKKRACQ